MKKILLLSVIAISFGLNSFSQTKKIAHRSHSGKDSEFNINGEDNFGLPPSYQKKTKADTTKAATKTDSSKSKTISKKVITKVKPVKTKAYSKT